MNLINKCLVTFCLLLSFISCTIKKQNKYKECTVLKKLSGLTTVVAEKDTFVLVNCFFVNLYSRIDSGKVYIATVKELHNQYIRYEKNGESFEDFIKYFLISYNDNKYNLKNSFYVDKEIMEEYKNGFRRLRRNYFIQNNDDFILNVNLSDSKVKTLLYLSFVNNYSIGRNEEDGNYYINQSTFKGCKPLFP